MTIRQIPDVPPFAILLALLGVAVMAMPALAQGQGDADKDGLRDRWERRWGITDPDRRDSDRDGIRDGMEDEDGDRLSNAGELRFRTDPTDPDSDDDGIRDGGDDADGNGIRDALEQDSGPLPKNLSPTLDDAFWDVPSSYSNGCHTGAYSAVIHPCVYGDEAGAVKVGLFGDSHALQWLPALHKAGRAQGWRITTLTKTACPSVDVEFTGAAFEGTEKPCRRWRDAALQWLRNNRQDVLIITNSGRYPLVNEAGDRVYAPNKEPLWQAGLARTLQALPRKTTTVVLADTPNLRKNPVSCLKQAWADPSDCVTRRRATRVPEHDAAERETAAANGALYAELQHVVCPYDPCPILNGRTLMWRNESHLTATYAAQLAPAVRGLVERALAVRKAGTPAEAAAAGAVAVEISLFDDRLEPDQLEVVAGRELLVHVHNEGRQQHELSFYRGPGGELVSEAAEGPPLEPGSSATLVLPPLEPGEYVFVDEAAETRTGMLRVAPAADGSD